MELSLLLKIPLSLALLGVCGFVIHLYKVLRLEPERLRRKLSRQGIRGPPPTFLFGNIPEMKRNQSKVMKPSREEHFSHDWAPSLFPYFEQWRDKYGPIFMFSLGNKQVLHVTKPDVVREISLCTSLNLGKPSYQQKEHGTLLGQGIVTSNGAMWVHQRKIIAPELFMEKVKGMVNIMVESTYSLLNSWESRLDSEGGVADIRIDEDLRNFAGDVISKACFGSNYSKRKEIFLRLTALQEAMSKRGFAIGVPGLRYFPTRRNRELWRLEKEIHLLILKVVKEREEAASEKDILQMILENAKNDNSLGPNMIDQFIVDNCKNIYLAGYETLAISAAWSLMLLASSPEWQARVRAEVLEVCGGQVPDADMLHRMKLLTMVIQETMRLYPPVVLVAREALQDMKLGDIHIPKGVNLWTLILTLHQDPENWGPDAYEFNPERFAHGLVGACKLPHLYMPFGFGPRICLGQNFAMVELKILLSLILSNFSFSLSPKYRHSPTLKLVLEPEHGANLLISRV